MIMAQEQIISGRTVVGKVISNKMQQTIVVQVERKVKHPLYGKYMRRFSKLYAHDVDNKCKIGDIVMIKMCRPISKKKSWTLVEVINQPDKEVAG
jgi:small subunit ribosomal protein S17